MKHKVYSHVVTFSGSPLVEGDWSTPIHITKCIPCLGSGFEPANFQPGAIITYPIPKCKFCSGKGVPPIPACEIGL